MSVAHVIRCPGCNAVFKLKSEIPKGKGVRCSQCGTAFKVADHSESEGIAAVDRSLPKRQHEPTRRTRHRSKDQQSSFGAWIVGGVLICLLLFACWGILQFSRYFVSSASKTSTVVTGGTSPMPPTVSHTAENSSRAATENGRASYSEETAAVNTEAASSKPLRFLSGGGILGLELVGVPDGPFEEPIIDGKPAVRLKGNYLYFTVDNDRFFDLPQEDAQRFAVTLEIFSIQPGTLDLQYDAHKVDAKLPHDGRWTNTEKVSLDGSREWRTATFSFSNARFADRQQGAADFRLRTQPAAILAVHEITLVPEEALPPPTIASGGNASVSGSQDRLPSDEPFTPVTTADLAPGFRVTWFSDTDFKKQTRQEILQKPIDFLWEESPREGIAADGWSTRYEGVIPISKAGEYKFHLKSDDGSRLWIDDELVVDNWGLHGPETKSGTIGLEPGLHTLRIDHFDDLYGAHLTLRIIHPKARNLTRFPLSLMRHDSRKTEGWKVVQGSFEPKEPPDASSEDPVVLAGEAADLKLVKEVELQTPPSHGGFHSFAFSPKGKILAGGTGLGGIASGGKTARFGGEVLLWTLPTGRLIDTLGSHGASVSSVMFSDDGETLVSVSKDNSLLKVWDVASRRERHRIHLAEDGFETPRVAPLVAIGPKGRHLAAAAAVPTSEGSNVFEHRELGIWGLSTGKAEWTLEDAVLEAMTFSVDGSLLLAEVKQLEGAEANSQIRYKQNLEIVQIDVESGQLTTRNPPAQERTLDELTFVKDSQMLAGLSADGLTLCDLNTNDVVGEFKWDDDRPFFDVFGLSSDGRYLLRGENEYLELSDLEAGKVIGLLTAEHPDLLWNLAISDDLRKVVCNFDHTPTVFKISRVER